MKDVLTHKKLEQRHLTHIPVLPLAGIPNMAFRFERTYTLIRKMVLTYTIGGDHRSRYTGEPRRAFLAQ